MGGVNLAGKTTFINGLCSHAQLNGIPVVGTTLSKLMMSIAGISTYDELARYDSGRRDGLRGQALDRIIQGSCATTQVLDTHFVFEDSEINHLHILFPHVRNVVVVTSPVEILLDRARIHKEGHPGRATFCSQEAILGYQNAEVYYAQRFLNSPHGCSQVYTPPLTLIDNQFATLDDYEAYIKYISRELLSEQVKIVEGDTLELGRNSRR